MPVSKKDEIMLQYADGIFKQADSGLYWQNILKSIGVDTSVEGAANAALLAAGVSASTLFAPLGIVLFLGGLGLGVYRASKKTDETVAELINKLEALDYEDTPVQKEVEKWIKLLQQYRGYFQFDSGMGKDQSEMRHNMVKIKKLTELTGYLETMNRVWPKVAPQLDDWKIGKWGDIGEAEVTLKQCLVYTKKFLGELKSEAQVALKRGFEKLRAAREKKTGRPVKSYSILAQEILNLHSKLAGIYGKAPSYDGVEDRAFRLANIIINDPRKAFAVLKANPSWVRYLSKLRDLLQKAITQTKAAFNSTNNISKRAALILPNGIKMNMDTGSKGIPGVDKKKAPRRKKSPVAKLKSIIQAIQKNANHVRAVFLPGLPQIAEDGAYGPETGALIAKLMLRSRAIRNIISSKVGLAPRDMRNWKMLYRDPSKIRALYGALSYMVQEIQNIQSRKQQSSGQVASPSSYTSNVPCPLKKDKLRVDEIDACLKQMVVKDYVTGKTMSAHDFLVKEVGAKTPAARAQWTWDALGAGSVGGLPKAERWLDWGTTLVRYVKHNKKGRYNII